MMSAFEKSNHYTGRGVAERIVRAAIFYDGVVYSVPQPGRHYDAMMETWKERREIVMLAPDTQGFVTSADRFVGRCEAAGIAIRSGQIKECKFQPDVLFSEDLW